MVGFTVESAHWIFVVFTNFTDVGEFGMPYMAAAAAGLGPSQAL